MKMIKIAPGQWLNADRIVAMTLVEKGELDPRETVVAPERQLIIDYHNGESSGFLTVRVEADWIPHVLAQLRPWWLRMIRAAAGEFEDE